jgi:predicted alpha/beta superfamily hydrolase
VDDPGAMDETGAVTSLALLKRSPEEELPRPAAEAVRDARASALPGEVQVAGPLTVPGLSPRRVRLYLPQGWRGEPRRALYLFDGQNVFGDEPSFAGGWHAHEAVEKLARTGPAPVVIGIDHGGEERIAELSPFDFRARPGRLDNLLDWLTGELMPALATAYGLMPDPAGTIVGGSSMGGLAALYAHFRHPQLFGGALSMSPSFWIADRAIFDWIAAQPAPAVSRIYLDCGEREGRGLLLPLVAAMAEHLARRGYGADRLLRRIDSRGAHNERSWRRRLPGALRFLLPRES